MHRFKDLANDVESHKVKFFSFIPRKNRDINFGNALHKNHISKTVIKISRVNFESQHAVKSWIKIGCLQFIDY